MGILSSLQGVVSAVQQQVQQRVIAPVSSTISGVQQAVQQAVSRPSQQPTAPQQSLQLQYIGQGVNKPQHQRIITPPKVQVQPGIMGSFSGVGSSMVKGATDTMSGIQVGMKPMTQQQGFVGNVGTFLGNVGTGAGNIFGGATQPIVQPVAKVVTSIPFVQELQQTTPAYISPTYDPTTYRPKQELTGVMKDITTGMKTIDPNKGFGERMGIFTGNVGTGISNIIRAPTETSIKAIEGSTILPSEVKGVTKFGVGATSGLFEGFTKSLTNPAQIVGHGTEGKLSTKDVWLGGEFALNILGAGAMKGAAKTALKSGLPTATGRVFGEVTAVQSVRQPIRTPLANIFSLKKQTVSALPRVSEEGVKIVSKVTPKLGTGVKTLESVVPKAGEEIKAVVSLAKPIAKESETIALKSLGVGKPGAAKASSIEMERIVDYLDNPREFKEGALKTVFDPLLEKRLNIDMSKINVKVLSPEQLANAGIKPGIMGTTIAPGRTFSPGALKYINQALGTEIPLDKPTVVIRGGMKSISEMGGTYIHEVAHAANKYGATADKTGKTSAKLLDLINAEATAFKTERLASEVVKDYYHGLQLTPKVSRLTAAKTLFTGELVGSKKHQIGTVVSILDPLGVNVLPMFAKASAITTPISKVAAGMITKAVPVSILIAGTASVLSGDEKTQRPKATPEQIERVRQYLANKDVSNVSDAELKAIMEPVYKEMGIKSDIPLHIVPTSRISDASGMIGASGKYMTEIGLYGTKNVLDWGIYKPGTGQIFKEEAWIKPTLKPAEAIGTGAHERGHGLYEKASTAPIPEKEQIAVMASAQYVDAFNKFYGTNIPQSDYLGYGGATTPIEKTVSFVGGIISDSSLTPYKIGQIKSSIPIVKDIFAPKLKEEYKVSQYVRRNEVKVKNYKKPYNMFNFLNIQHHEVKPKNSSLHKVPNMSIFGSDFLSLSNGLNSYNMLTLSFIKTKKVESVNKSKKKSTTSKKK